MTDYESSRSDQPQRGETLPPVAAELELAFGEFAGQLDALIVLNRNPVFAGKLVTLKSLVQEIALFFRRIKELIALEAVTGQQRFAVGFFMEHWSIISENTKAARSILKYALHDPVWFAEKSEKTFEWLKSLYAEIVSLGIECAEQYRRLTGKEFEFEFTSSVGEGGRTTMDRAEAFRVLELEPGSDRERVKNAFRRLAKRLHPDMNPEADQAAFIRLERAYRTLIASVPAGR